MSFKSVYLGMSISFRNILCLVLLFLFSAYHSVTPMLTEIRGLGAGEHNLLKG